jgi:hypothetical protein
MELLGDVGKMEDPFGLFGDSARCQIAAPFVLNVQQTQKSFWAHLMELLGDVGQVEACFGLLRVNLGAR